MSSPKHMRRLREAMSQAHPVTEFCQPGAGVKTILNRLGRRDDFSGCDVLLHSPEPFYVGISRCVIRRVRQHVTGKTHYDASLAYLMASRRVGRDMQRQEAMKDPAFRQQFDQAKQELRRCCVAFVEIENALELHLFEACCAMELDTGEWNTFRTH